MIRQCSISKSGAFKYKGTEMCPHNGVGDNHDGHDLSIDSIQNHAHFSDAILN